MKPSIQCLLLSALLLTVGCAHRPSTVSGEHAKDSALQPWVEDELAPYLAEQLSSHPRFRGEPAILVKFEGPDIQPEIDGLTRGIRVQIRETLLNTPGITLPWQPRQREQRHHRRLDRVNCRNIHEASYYIAIEIMETLSGDYSVSVRALDVQAREWVTGFGMAWRGALTASERRALQRLQPDEALRGLRVLPFEPGQTDLAADYLANNLSCLLQQSEEEELVVYLQRPGRNPAFLAGTLKLIGNNLSRYREVRVSDDKVEAGFILRADAHELQSGLYQVWVRLNPKRSGIHLSGMDTATYLVTTTGKAAAPAVERATRDYPRVTAARVAKPVISRMELAATSDEQCSTDESGYPLRCKVLTLEVKDLDQLFVIAHSPQRGLTRLLPAGCSGGNGSTAGAARSFRLTGEGPRGTTFYAIAVNGARLKTQFSHHLQRLPSRCAGAAASGASVNGLDRWLNQLDGMIASNRERVAWSARRVD